MDLPRFRHRTRRFTPGLLIRPGHKCAGLCIVSTAAQAAMAQPFPAHSAESPEFLVFCATAAHISRCGGISFPSVGG